MAMASATMSATQIVRDESFLSDAPDVYEEPDSETTDDFARLVPQNELARIAFDEVASQFKSNEDWEPHARQFICIAPEQASVDDSSTSESDSQDRSPTPQPKKRRWTGYYRLNFSHPPNDLRYGWFLGCGRPDVVVDLLLATNPNPYRVHGINARFTHVGDQFQIRAEGRRRVILDGIDEVKDSGRIIWKSETGLSVGDLQYRVQFLASDSMYYAEGLRRMREAAGLPISKSPAPLDPTPSEYKYELHGYIFHRPLGGGSTCTVSPATEVRTGRTFAIKKRIQNSRTKEHINWEIQINKTTGRHPRICHLHEIFSTSQERSSLFYGNVHETYLVYSPLAFDDCYQHFGRDDTPLEHKHLLIKHWLEGIAFLHSKGIIHRDIKPQNLVYQETIPPKGLVIDLGAACQADESRDHMAGTIPYLAPEVIHLKRRDPRGPTYTNKADIWSFGITTYELVCRAKPTWREMTTEQYVILAEQLKEDEESARDEPEVLPMIQMIRYMIHYRPRHRSSARELLALPIMTAVSTEADFNSAQEPKRSRDEDAPPSLKSPRQSSSSIH